MHLTCLWGNQLLPCVMYNIDLLNRGYCLPNKSRFIYLFLNRTGLSGSGYEWEAGLTAACSQNSWQCWPSGRTPWPQRSIPTEVIPWVHGNFVSPSHKTSQSWRHNYHAQWWLCWEGWEGQLSPRWRGPSWHAQIHLLPRKPSHCSLSLWSHGGLRGSWSWCRLLWYLPSLQPRCTQCLEESEIWLVKKEGRRRVWELRLWLDLCWRLLISHRSILAYDLHTVLCFICFCPTQNSEKYTCTFRPSQRNRLGVTNSLTRGPKEKNTLSLFIHSVVLIRWRNVKKLNWQLSNLILSDTKHPICQRMLRGWRGVALNSGGKICSITKLWKLWVYLFFSL